MTVLLNHYVNDHYQINIGLCPKTFLHMESFKLILDFCK